MKRLALFLLGLLTMLAFTQACETTQINNVPEEQQDVERFMLRTHDTLVALSGTYEVLYLTAADLVKADKMSLETFKEVDKVAAVFDSSWQEANRLHRALRVELDEGNKVSTAALAAAMERLVANKDRLMELVEGKE